VQIFKKNLLLSSPLHGPYVCSRQLYLNKQLLANFGPHSVGSMCTAHPAHPVATSIGATSLCDPWDASPPAVEIVGTKNIWAPPTFTTGAGRCHHGKLIALPRPPVAEFKAEGKEE